MRLILASASPRRAELLRAAGYEFEVVVADVDEREREGETPGSYVRRLAAEKSAAVQAALKGCATSDMTGEGDHAPVLVAPVLVAAKSSASHVMTARRRRCLGGWPAGVTTC